MATKRSLVWRGLAAGLALLLAAPTALYLSLPGGNTAQARFDTLIVLGYPADAHGAPTPEMRERVLEAVREFKAGIAPRIIMTGGAAHSRFVEADVMARLAVANGVPATSIVTERQARNTLENAAYSVRIMQARGWRSAEVISAGSHLPRAGLIFAAYPVTWRTHASPWPAEYPRVLQIAAYGYEIFNATRLWLKGMR